LTSSEGTHGTDERVLVLLRESRDAGSVPRVLESIGVASLRCATPEELCAEIDKGAGAVLAEEEALSPEAGALLLGTLHTQPSWSELPIILLLRRGPETRMSRDALLLPGDVTLVERPVRVNTLVAIVRSALRSRHRQYLLRDDMNERIRVEEEIKRLNAELATRAGELEAANRELEAFNYAVAHDLRTPLTVISGYIGLIQKECGNALGECQEYLQNAYEGSLRMSQLISALLEFSDLAQIEPKRERTNLVSMAQEIVEELRTAEPERRVTARITEAGVEATGDPSLLRVALANLLGNAWKYTRMREESVIEFGATQMGGETTWFVRDNGAGFEMADAVDLFLPFKRLRGAEDFGGHGIGLATVARVIQRHGGRIWAEGKADVGATFYFTLPTPANGFEAEPTGNDP
jgi:signal transduction histidine kinase